MQIDSIDVKKKRWISVFKKLYLSVSVAHPWLLLSSDWAYFYAELTPLCLFFCFELMCYLFCIKNKWTTHVEYLKKQKARRWSIASHVKSMHCAPMKHKIDSFNWKNISWNTTATAVINGLYCFTVLFLACRQQLLNLQLCNLN